MSKTRGCGGFLFGILKHRPNCFELGPQEQLSYIILLLPYGKSGLIDYVEDN